MLDLVLYQTSYYQIYSVHVTHMFQENHNPFGIGDVVIAKYTPGPGRPYWPGKVLSATGA